MNRWPVLFALFLVASVTSRARADDGAVSFPKGTLSLQTYATYGGGIDAKEAIGSGAAGVSYYVFDNFSLGLEASGYHVTQSPGRNARMYGLAGVMRHHLLRFERTSIFADVTFGPVEATERVPNAGTYFNFATRSGIGATYQLRDHLHLLGGVRYFHLSNAHIEGREHNPSINGVEGFVGLMWTP